MLINKLQDFVCVHTSIYINIFHRVTVFVLLLLPLPIVRNTANKSAVKNKNKNSEQLKTLFVVVKIQYAPKERSATSTTTKSL